MINEPTIIRGLTQYIDETLCVMVICVLWRAVYMLDLLLNYIIIISSIACYIFYNNVQAFPLYIIILSLLKIFSQVRHSLMADCMGQNTSTARAFRTSGCRPLIGRINKWKKK